MNFADKTLQKYLNYPHIFEVTLKSRAISTTEAVGFQTYQQSMI